MSVKYRKWRELSIEPSNIKFKHIKLISIVSYPPAQNDVVESIVEMGNKQTKVFIKFERSMMSEISTENKHLNILKKERYYQKIPNVLEFGNVKNKNYIVLEKLEGRRLSDILKSENVNKEKYLIKYGKELAIIHQIPNDCFNNAKQRVVNDIPNEETGIKINEELMPYLKYLEQHKILMNSETFIHGDFHYANILWKNGNINGVLDWEYSGKGFKEQDIAWACVLRPTQTFMNSLEDIKCFLKGYTTQGTFNCEKFKWCLINAYLHFYIINNTNDIYINKLKILIEQVYNANFNIE